MSMTTEQKIITIAEFEGYSRKECPAGEIEWLGPSPKRQYIGRFSPETIPSKLPPYLTSRDAICGAVARLDSMEFFYFVERLERICGTDGWEIMTSDDMRRILLATPAQLADALLLTLGYQI